MRIIITGGDTGGHIFPALEIASEIKRQHPHATVILAGNNNSLEEKMAKAAGVKFFGLTTKKVVDQSLFKKLVALVYLKLAVVKSLWFLLKDRPKAVIGVGGYVSAPMLLASALLGIKRYLCEQNVMPGLANRSLAWIANRIFISFAESRQYFPEKKTILTGNPVRKEFFELKPTMSEGQPLRILVTGGSLGANFLNQQVPYALGLAHNDCPHLTITHQTGKDQVTAVKKLYEYAGLKAEVVTFIDNMPQAFSHHDLLISRAGATVCAEIMAAGMPAILVPYPFANGHQKYNALALEKSGAAIMIEQGQNFASLLARSVKDLYLKQEQLGQMGKKAQTMGSWHAASAIVNYVLND